MYRVRYNIAVNGMEDFEVFTKVFDKWADACESALSWAGRGSHLHPVGGSCWSGAVLINLDGGYVASIWWE